MSLTGVSPLITSWIERELEWGWFWRPKRGPFTIPAKSQVQLPSSTFTFEAPEGTLLTFSAGFDHPNCGIRLECHPELDTGFLFTISQISMAGFYNMPMYITTMIPPRTPAGIYFLSQQKEWPWTEWARLYVINDDSVPHRCIGYAYTMAMRKKQRTED